MRVRALAPVVLALVAGGLPMAVAGADVHATIGTNAVPMPEHSTPYRLELDGTATRAAPRAPSGVTTSPDGRYGVTVGDSGIVLIDQRSGARRPLARWSPFAAAYWSSQSVLAFTIHVSRIERLVVLDPATGRRRRLASRICDTAVDPWSPDGTRLALAVSLPHLECREVAAAPTVIAVTRTWDGPLHRILGPRRLPWTELLAWTRDGSGLLVTGGDRTQWPVTAVIDLRTGNRRAAFPSYVSMGHGAWSSGRRFFVMPTTDASSRASLLVVDSAFRSRVGSFTVGQQAYAYAWAPGHPWLAFASSSSVRVFDASTRRVIATIPVRAPFSFGVDSLTWSPDARSVTMVAEPGLGHD
jgi:DNA-binding beta-propeller fold protein YncE